MIEVKKGEKVIVKGFTGIKLGVFEVDKADKKTVTILKKNGDEMVFDRKTGKQVNVAEGKEKYANSIMEDDGSYVAPSTKKVAKKKASKPTTKKAKPEPEDDEDDDDEDEEEEKPVPKKSKPVKKAAKKTKKVVEEDDDDDFEDMDD